jgi:hypothetical protein
MTKELKKNLINIALTTLVLTGFSLISVLGYCIFNATLDLGLDSLKIFGVETLTSRWFDLFIIPLAGLLISITYFLRWKYNSKYEQDITSIMLTMVNVLLFFAFAFSVVGGIFVALFIVLIWAMIMGLIFLFRALYCFAVNKPVS